MAFAAENLHLKSIDDEARATKILNNNMNKAKEGLVKLQQSYDTAVGDIQKHFSNASAALTSTMEEARKELDTYMLNYQKKLRKEIQNIRDLLETLPSNVSNGKVEKGSSNGDVSMDSIHVHDPVLYSMYKTPVEDVPSIRFIGNEAFLFKIGNYLPYFGSFAINSTVLASDLHLHGPVDTCGPCFTFKIDVPKRIPDIDDLKLKINCEVFVKDSKASMCVTPLWTANCFEIKFGFERKSAFTLCVYLLDQHISGSPVHYDPKKNMAQIDNCDIKDMEIVEPSPKRSMDTLDPLVEAALLEINIGVNNTATTTASTTTITTLTTTSINSSDNNNKNINNHNIINNNSNNNNNQHMNSFGVKKSLPNKVYKISKKTKPPHSSMTFQSRQDSIGRTRDSEGDENMTVEETEIVCYEEDILPSKKEPTKQENLDCDIVFDGYATDNLVITTMKKNAVVGCLAYIIHIESPYSLNRPVGILEHSSGDIFVSDTFNDRVLRLNRFGGPIGVAGPSLEFRRPSSLVELNNGSFGVICSNCIALFDAKGNKIDVLGKKLLQKPYGLSLSEEGKLITVETAYVGTLVIVTFCPELKSEISRIRVPLHLPPTHENLSKPRFTGIYMNKIYVGDLGLDCIYEINYMTGCLLSTFGKTGSKPGCLRDPSGIACDSDGNIFVADSRNHRIEVFDSSKNFVCTVDLDHPLNRPSGIYFARDDHLFVLNYWENTIAKYHLTYKYV